jgi:hypothetical protein
MPIASQIIEIGKKYEVEHKKLRSFSETWNALNWKGPISAAARSTHLPSGATLLYRILRTLQSTKARNIKHTESRIRTMHIPNAY